MRILAITHQYPTPEQPTFAAYNRQQFAQLARFHELRIIRPVPWPIVARQMLRGGRQSFAETNEDGIKVHYPTFYYPPRILRVHYGVFYERSIAAIVRKTLTAYQPDVILGGWAHPDGWAAARLGHEAGIPVVTKVLGSDVLALAQGQRRAGVADALRAADGVVTVSEDLARHVMQLGVASNRVHVVPEGVDGDRFAPGDRGLARARLGLPQDMKLVLFVGNLLVSKGAADLVKACALLRDRGVAFCCRLVGHGRDAGTIAELVRAHNLENHVVLTGARPHAEIADWYRASDVVALPSYSEGIPNVLREAMACGKPFVATNVGGIPEIANPSFSRLVAPGAVTDLACALGAMLASPPSVNPELVRSINISWESSARLLVAQLESVIQTRRIGNEIRQSAGRRSPTVRSGTSSPTAPHLDSHSHRLPALRGENIICFGKDWNLDPTSNHHVMSQLARHNRVLWINSIAMRAPAFGSARDLRKVLKKIAAFGAPKNVQDDLWVYTPLVLPFPHSRFATRLNVAILKATLRTLRRRLRMERFQLWTFLPNAAEYAGQLGESLLVYYCVDEWSKFSYIDGRRMADLEEKICRAADLVFATSPSLVDKLLPMNSETHLATHGVDYEYFASALLPSTQVPRYVASLPGPVIGFFGLVQDWLDLDLLEFLARRHPEWSFAMIGEICTDVSRFTQYQNVHFLGRKPHAELAGACKGFAVGLIPHRVNELTRHMSPIKLREYLSAGLPVVSTALPEAIRHRNDLIVAADFEAFERGIEESLQQTSPALKRARSEAMAKETWEGKVQSLTRHVMRVAS